MPLSRLHRAGELLIRCENHLHNNIVLNIILVRSIFTTSIDFSIYLNIS